MHFCMSGTRTQHKLATGTIVTGSRLDEGVIKHGYERLDRGEFDSIKRSRSLTLCGSVWHAGRSDSR